MPLQLTKESLEKLTPEQREVFNQALKDGERIGSLIADRVPQEVIKAKDSVLGASQVFYKAPTRHSALLFADACRRGSKKLRKVEAPVKELRFEVATGFEDMATVLDVVAELLYQYDPNFASVPLLTNLRDQAIKLKEAEERASQALEVMSAEMLKEIYKQLQNEGLIAPTMETAVASALPTRPA